MDRTDSLTGTLIRIGVVGSSELVERTMFAASGRAIHGVHVRLLPVTYEMESQAADRLRRVRADLDAALFAGPLAYDLVREHGPLDIPATYVEVGGSALFAALLRVVRDFPESGSDVSIDSVAVDDAREAFIDSGLDESRLRVAPYESPQSADRFVDFHVEHFRAGHAKLALTTVPHVESELRQQDVPVLRIKPTTASLRDAVRRAALVGTGRLLGDSQPAVILLRFPAPTPRPMASGDVGSARLRVELVDRIATRCRAVGASLAQDDDWSFRLMTTVSGLAALTSDFTVAPLVDRDLSDLGLRPEVGVGVAGTLLAAEECAHTAVAQGSPDTVVVVTEGGRTLPLPLGPEVRPEPESVSPEAQQSDRAAELGDRLRAMLATESDEAEARVVDAESVSQMLDVSRQTARRLLKDLVDQGAAWTLPTRRTSQPGRPRRLYRVL